MHQPRLATQAPRLHHAAFFRNPPCNFVFFNAVSCHAWSLWLVAPRMPRQLTPTFRPDSVITSLVLSERVFDTDTISVIGKEKKPTDDVEIPLTIQVTCTELPGASVNLVCQVYREGGTTAIYSIGLTATSANHYMASLKVKIKRGDVGDYRIDVTGTDQSGAGINHALSKFFCDLRHKASNPHQGHRSRLSHT